jgi:hypothetical protein
MSRSRYSGAQENGGVREDSAIPARALLPTDQGSPRSNCIGASIRWTDRARGNEPARIPQWHPGQYEVPTNDEPRQPARPETRPNQRLYVSLGSPPSVAVGSSSARAAHRSRASQIDILRITSIAARVKISRCVRQPKFDRLRLFPTNRRNAAPPDRLSREMLVLADPSPSPAASRCAGTFSVWSGCSAASLRGPAPLRANQNGNP